jgi:hypothetical protein
MISQHIIIQSDLDIDGGVEANCWHNRTHELKKDHKCLMRFDLLAVFLGFVNEIF